MITGFRAYETETGSLTAIIELIRNENVHAHLTGSITPVFYHQRGLHETEQTLGDAIAISFPCETPDDYIVKNLLKRTGVLPKDIGTRIKYVEN
jgi:phage tail protein X